MGKTRAELLLEAIEQGGDHAYVGLPMEGLPGDPLDSVILDGWFNLTKVVEVFDRLVTEQEDSK